MDGGVFYLHEDDWGMLDIVPVENLFQSATVAKEADAHAEAHRAPDGIGWTELYELPAPTMGIGERAIAVEALGQLLGPGWRRAARVESGYSSFREHRPSAFALTDGANWFYGTVADGIVGSLHLRDRSVETLDALVRLAQRHRLILNDWWQHVVVDLSNPDSARRWLTEQ
jgi:hypothetical protein